MKKILFFTVMLFAAGAVFAQLKFTENFGSMTGTTLGTQNSWAPSPVSGTDVGLVVSANNTGALTYPNYTSGQNYITVARTNGRDPYRIFTSGGGGVSTTSNSVFFVSFVVKVPSAANVQTTANATYSITLRNSGNSSYLCRFYIGKDAGNNIEFGISTDGSTEVFTNGNYAANTTYLIVMRYDVVTGINNDDAYLWVNPSLSGEPSTASANATDLNDEPNYGSTIDAIMIHQRDNSDSPIAQFDAFRVSNRSLSATAWSDLAAQGAPLPVKLSGIKAYEKQSGIQIDWTAYSEENLSNYQVERSADGKTFSTIGTVAARNSMAETKYDWFDAAPLPGVNFYRLKTIDIDSKTGYSAVVRVSLDKETKSVTIYPNPVQNGYLSFQSADLSRGDYWIKITNGAGQQLYSRKFNHNGGAINQTIELPRSIRSGMYTLQIENREARVISKSFIVQ